MKARIHITLRSGVLDPQGKATTGALHHLGFAEVEAVRIGKYLELDLAGGDRAQAEQRVKAMCEGLLANTVVESYRFEIE